jgi:hypothetical protein
MYTIINVIQHSVIHLHAKSITYVHGAFPLAPPTPCWFPFVSPSTYLAPSSCDRNRPPPSQVACKLTRFTPPFTQLPHPFQIPRTPTAPSLTMTTSGIFQLLLSGTGTLSAHTLLEIGVMEIFLSSIEWISLFSYIISKSQRIKRRRGPNWITGGLHYKKGQVKFRPR